MTPKLSHLVSNIFKPSNPQVVFLHIFPTKKPWPFFRSCWGWMKMSWASDSNVWTLGKTWQAIGFSNNDRCPNFGPTSVFNFCWYLGQFKCCLEQMLIQGSPKFEILKTQVEPPWSLFHLCWLYGSPVWFCEILIFVASILSFFGSKSYFLLVFESLVWS